MGDHRYHRIIYFVFSVTLSAFFAFCFYFTPVGDEIENRLYHLRNTLKPKASQKGGVAVLQSPVTDADPYLATFSSILAQNPKTLNIIFSLGVKSYPPKAISKIYELASKNPKIFLGIPNFSPTSQIYLNAPRLGSPVNIYSYDAPNSSQNLFSRAPFGGSALGPQGGPFLPAKILDLPSGEPFFVNFLSKSNIPQFSLSDLKGPPSPTLSSQHLFIQFDPSFNIKKPHPKKNFASMENRAFYLANLTLNLIHNSSMKVAHPLVALIQTLIVSILFGLIWRVGVTFATFLILLGWGLLLYAHGFLMSHYQYFIPLADTALFATIFGVIGALWRLSHEGQLKIEQQVRTQSQKDLSETQTKFLTNFSTGLSLINRRIMASVQNHKGLLSQDKKLGPVYKGLLSSCEELGDYLDGILAFSKMTSKEHSYIRRRTFKLQKTLHRIAQPFMSECEKRRLRIDVVCQEGLEVCSEETLVELIMTNLLSNAVKYSPDGGKITIKTEFVKKRSLKIMVLDEGPGIHKDHQKMIFEKFYRVENDSRLTIKGNGLGLYLCRFFADKIGAELSVESSLGEGACFTLTLHKV